MAGRRSTDSILDQQIAQSYPRELVTLQVDPAWQRRGVGRKLVAAVAVALMKEGETNLLVQVLAENPNVAFYKALGARLVGSQPYDWEGYPATSLIFVWDALRADQRSLGSSHSACTGEQTSAETFKVAS